MGFLHVFCAKIKFRRKIRENLFFSEKLFVRKQIFQFRNIGILKFQVAKFSHEENFWRPLRERSRLGRDLARQGRQVREHVAQGSRPCAPHRAKVRSLADPGDPWGPGSAPGPPRDRQGRAKSRQKKIFVATLAPLARQGREKKIKFFLKIQLEIDKKKIRKKNSWFFVFSAKIFLKNAS